MHVERADDGQLWVGGLTPLHADTFLRMPALIESEDSRVRGRLSPEVYDDPDDQEQWRRHATPEIEHLFLSRVQILRADLAGMVPEDERCYRMPIAIGHELAWLSSLNAARLALFTLNDLTPQDMERTPDEIEEPERELVLVRIHIMAYLQELLMEQGVT